MVLDIELDAIYPLPAPKTKALRPRPSDTLRLSFPFLRPSVPPAAMGAADKKTSATMVRPGRNPRPLGVSAAREPLSQGITARRPVRSLIRDRQPGLRRRCGDPEVTRPDLRENTLMALVE